MYTHVRVPHLVAGRRIEARLHRVVRVGHRERARPLAICPAALTRAAEHLPRAGVAWVDLAVGPAPIGLGRAQVQEARAAGHGVGHAGNAVASVGHERVAVVHVCQAGGAIEGSVHGGGQQQNSNCNGTRNDAHGVGFWMVWARFLPQRSGTDIRPCPRFFQGVPT